MKVFFDTMIFLHYRDLDQIDLPNVLGVSDITVMIPRTVINELDKHKDSTHLKRKIRERARSSLQKIESWFEGTEVRPGISAFECYVRPKFDLAGRELDPNRNDDVLIATVLQFKSDNPNDAVVLVTQDVGPKLSARRLGIQVMELPRQYALPDDPDPIERENQELKARIARIENALPRVSAVFLTENGYTIHQKIVIRQPPALDEEAMRVQLDKRKSSLPEFHPPPPSVTAESPLAAFQQVLKTNLNDVISQGEYDRYNRERGEYFIAYEAYLRRQSDYDAMRYVGTLLEIAVINSGTAPAEDVDVLLHFPDGFSLYSSENLPKAPEEPTRPINPRSTLAMFTGRLDFAASLPKPYFPDIHALSTMVSSFSIRRTRSYEVEDCFHSIKHGEHERIRDLLLVFDSFESARGFSIDYTLRPRNLPEPVTGQLHIEVEK